MKTLLIPSAALMLLVCMHQITISEGFSNREPRRHNKPAAWMKYDTMTAVLTTQSEYPSKSVARDTIILVISGTSINRNPPKKAAGNKYSFEVVSYDPFDTVQPVKAVARDTIVWVSKPFRPN